MIINIASRAGKFAENKERASRMRAQAAKALRSGEDVTFDFGDVAYATQSFVHALISELIRNESLDALDHMEFKDCSDAVRSVVEIVVSYSQDDWSAEVAPA